MDASELEHQRRIAASEKLAKRIVKFFEKNETGLVLGMMACLTVLIFGLDEMARLNPGVADKISRQFLDILQQAAARAGQQKPPGNSPWA